MSFCVGEAIGDYVITGDINAKDCQLYQVEHRITKRREVMRVVLAELIYEGNVDRLTREVEVLAQLDHPGIAGVHNAFSLIDRFLLISEFVEGQSLAELISQGLPLEAGLDYVRQALAALAYAHSTGVVHGNITPENLLITAAGVVKIVNFGFVRSLHDLPGNCLREESLVLSYTAPMHSSGYLASDPRTDVYSMSAVLCEIARGKLRSDTEGVDMMAAQFQLDSLAPRQALRGVLRDVILRALSHDPLLRYQSANELLSAIDNVKGQSAARYRQVQRFPTLGKTAIGALAILSIIAILKFNMYQAPARPAAFVFAIPVPNLAGVSPTSTMVPTRKKRLPTALPQSVPISSENIPISAVEAIVETPKEQEPEPVSAVAEVAPPQPEKKGMGMWSKLRKINPFHKRKNMAIPNEPMRRSVSPSSSLKSPP